MKIENAVISDAEEMLSIQRLAYRIEAAIYNDYSLPPLLETLNQVQNDFQTKTILKATENSRLVGSVRARSKDGTCFISRLVVHPDFQNRGIGTRLMNEIESRFSDAKRFELFTGSKSKRNIHLYQKLGYRIFKEERASDRVMLVYFEK
jgi:ribosomal protein S18 acetylase RimI-like enzyme